MRTGELVARSGVNLQTLRYYERRGLLRALARRPSGYRVYGLDAVDRVRFIKRAQALGFTLDEIAGLLALRDGRPAHRAHARESARTKLAAVDGTVAELVTLRGELAELVAACEADGVSEQCPIVGALSERPQQVSEGRA